MKKTTDELMNNIKNVLSIEDFFKDNKSEYFNITADQYLRKLLQEKDLKVSQIAVSSCLGNYVYKVFNGSRKANRDVYIAIGILKNRRTLDGLCGIQKFLRRREKMKKR